MIPVYAICVVAGSLAALGWIGFAITASGVAGKEHLDPEIRFGEPGRFIVAGVFGFGLGGMSASFAGWGSLPALLGAIGGAALLIAGARYLGVEQDEPTGVTGGDDKV